MLIPEQLNKTYMTAYPNAADQALMFREMKTTGEQTWPDWCYLPVAAASAIVVDEIEKRGVDMAQAASDIGNLAAILAWMPTKSVYRFDPDLLKSLWDVTLDKDIPVDVLFNLPSWCCYIDLEGFAPADRMKLHGFFVYLESDANSGGREIRLTFARPGDDGSGIMTLPFHIDDQTKIGDMLQSTLDFSNPYLPNELKDLKNFQVDQADAAELYSSYFSLVLYLCSADRDIIQTSKVRKVKKSKNPKKKKRQLPVEYRVGSAIGGAIRRARGSSQGTGEGTKKSPHIRKAHYHTYWTGKGRKKPVVKFIAPVPVNIGDEPVVPIVRRVK
ncbi:AcrVA2 family anti-CRISPR protein [Desulfobacula toluolica]|uniref:Conserved uncharacterized protein n=1 Tax=Desulfobacula toluolica (strain DSM 7467 / Tol2) TaxID=651182 RepID=K0NTL8_DESTT|nr:hypothetical protein [Desulfobacula toluolica]CCK82422.1 conserved uncharacterized protein [Desulfobacula toluolica Tol2]